jgi:hypothetical protein
MFAVNLGLADKKACIMVGLYGVLHVVETDAVEGGSFIKVVFAFLLEAMHNPHHADGTEERDRQ